MNKIVILATCGSIYKNFKTLHKICKADSIYLCSNCCWFGYLYAMKELRYI